MRRRETAPRQQNGLRCGNEPCRSEDRGKDDRERYSENKGSRNGETEADRALIFRGRRRIPGRRTAVFRTNARLRRAQAGSMTPVQANFMDVSDREPELQCQSQQRKPRAETAWYGSNAPDHPRRC